MNELKDISLENKTTFSIHSITIFCSTDLNKFSTSLPVRKKLNKTVTEIINFILRHTFEF